MQRAAKSIYVHYPYCAKLCSFCAFNKYRVRDDHDVLLDAYKVELKRAIQSGQQIRSVYFGGGTPSLFPQLVPEILTELSRLGCEVKAATEVTLEANPNSLPNIRDLAENGVTRLSLGVQSLTNSDRLRVYNRDHDVSIALKALDRLVANRHLLRHGFSFDLMFANPGESLAAWDREITAAVSYAQVGGHISLYELTVERGTPLARAIARKELALPDSDTIADQYDLATRAMTQAGLVGYEVSSFAVPGHESLHNSAFWLGEDLLGIGPGAHGRHTIEGLHRTRNIAEPRLWVSNVQQHGHGMAKIDNLSDEEFAHERIAVGLRTIWGVPYDHFGRYLDPEVIRLMCDSGLVTQEPLSETTLRSVPLEWRTAIRGTKMLRATSRGRAVLDMLTPQILI
ncbi:hypothetical protein PYCC9005_005110 [Savitreella phatthalungensis]